jgi:PQQ-dependent dehydrogenase (methanol/ethanol family)
MKLTLWVTTALLCAAVPAVGAATAPGTKSEQDEGQWAMPAKDYSATRYSGLSQITRANAHGLHPVWTFSTGVLGGHEGQPLVVNNTMYVVTPWPNVLYAFDLTKEGYPLKWKYRPAVSPNAIGIACCDSVNRGAFYSDGRIFYNLLDGHTVAIDAKTGHELWNTQIAEVKSGETTTMAPLVVKDRVIVGASGGEFGIYGWLKALDAATGKIIWTAHNIGPDADMLAHPDTFRPQYVQGPDLGANSWDNSSWKTGGAPVWGWLSYDPDLDLVFYGVGNPSPYNPEQRVGDNKWSNSVLARRPGDGSLIWAYQFTPHDNWDYDSTGPMILADVKVSGKPVKALVHFDKNGFLYVLDRASGKLINATAFVQVTWASSIDLQSGKPVLDPARQTGASKSNIKGICPSLEGGVSPASPPAYSPHLGWFFTSTNNFCMDYEASRSTYLRGTPYIGANSPYTAGPGGHLGALAAWDAAAGRKVWEIDEPYPSWSGVLATAGDVVFYGTLDGWFKSVDATTGKVLSKYKVGSGVVGNPMTFRGPDGQQYVAVYAGIGGDWELLTGDTHSDDPADVRAPMDMMKTIARHTSKGGLVWIFGL